MTSFDILRDTGNSDPLSITVDPAIVGNKPSLREYVVTGLTNVGSMYRFKIRAHNIAGQSESVSMLHVTLAAVPDKPTTGPVSDASVTNDNRIKVNFGPLLDSQNGGSPVLSYDL